MALGDVIARLAVSLSLDTAAFEKGATIGEKRMAQLHKRLESVGKKMTNVGKVMSVAVTAPIVAFAATSIKAAQESAEAMGQVDAALKSMGDGAGRTREQLAGLASGIMRKSLFDDDEILRKVTANLLTFGNVAGEQFDRAQQAAVDLSARMGTDLQSSAILVGKALNDPIKGLASLTRVGIQFTEQQKAQIKSMVEAGNAAGAQKIILGELERQFSGSAEAMRKADPGGAFKQSLNELQEVIGSKLLPVLTPLIEKITAAVQWFTDLPAPVQNTALAFAGVAAVIGPILLVLGPMVPLITALVPVVTALGAALLFIAANPAILALAAVIGGIYLAWKNWDKIEPIVLAVYNAVKKWLAETGVMGIINALLIPLRAVIAVWKNWDQIKAILAGLYNAAKEWLADKLVKVLNSVLGPVRAVNNAFKWLKDQVVGNSHIPDMVDGIQEELTRLDEVLVRPVEDAVAATNAAFASIGDIALPTLADVANDNAKEIEATNVRITKSFKDMAEDTLNALDRLAQSIKGGGFLDILSAVIGLGLQLGSLGVFGKKVQTNVNLPRFATGTNFAPGGLALVGERGPELVNLPRGSRVTPNNRLGGNTYILKGNLLTPEFWAQIQMGDISAAQGGAFLAQANDARRRKWALA